MHKFPINENNAILQQTSELCTFPVRIENLPMVEAVFDHFQEISFENTYIIGAQHILPTTLQMFSSFFSRGLDPENVYLIGKCYSTDFLTFERMKRMGMNICPSSVNFQKGISFDKIYKKNILLFLKEIKKKISQKNLNFKKIIILDDGGKLIHYSTQIFSSYALNIIGVEQTTAGYEELKQVKLNFPVINVARSKAKLQYESPLIAQTLAEELYSKFIIENFTSKKMLIVGNGAIGKAMFQAFKQNFEIDYYDANPSKSNISQENLKKSLSNYDLILGCTGRRILKFSDAKFLKTGTVLASASSSDREFSAHEFQNNYPGHLECHDDFEVNGIKILNSGFPVNFGKNPSLTDPPVFQLTRALLSAAILNALVSDYPNKIISLNDRLQTSIIDHFLFLDLESSNLLRKKNKFN